MRVRKVLPVVLAAVSLTILAGCGGGPSSAGVPQGNFTNANLSGTYAFAFSGTNTGTGGFFAMAGSFVANGGGTITSGTIDINSPTTSGVLTNVALTGTYIVHADGRGTATLIPSGFNNINLNFVLLSNQHGAVVRFDNQATASGSLDLQDSSAFNLATLAGSFAFTVSGVDGGGAPEASAGVFTVDATGTVTAGVEDSSDNGSINANLALTAGTTLTAPSGNNGRGTLTITSGVGTRNFAVYVVNANTIRIIEIDSSPVQAGDGFRQTSTSITGSFAFTASGTTGNLPFVAGGILSTDGAGNVSNSVEDTNTANGGNPNLNVALSGAFSAITNGRGTLSLNGSTINYAVYPSSAGLVLFRIDSNFVVSGTAFQQSGSFSDSTISGRYGANVSGVFFNGINFLQFDAVYQFTANGAGKLTGAQDVNSFGTLSANLALNGAAHLGSNGRASAVGSLNTAAGNLSVIYYAVSSSQILFIEIDSNAAAVGAFSQQQ